MLERERKYLVKELPDLTDLTPKRILQGYFGDQGSDDADPLRIRSEGGAYILTKKFQVEAGQRGLANEASILLSKQEFDILWPHVLHKLEKDRYVLPLGGGLEAELDVFHGKLEGFVQVEVEFPDADTEAAFEPPAWFGPHITPFDWAWNGYYAKTDWSTLKGIIEKEVKEN